ncbi:MAG: HlyC/CorC family transporter [Alphaproteobacteria bacterium]|nr:HlyC/CorC family transporter [Alphaproteobacteria bacterium]
MATPGKTETSIPSDPSRRRGGLNLAVWFKGRERKAEAASPETPQDAASADLRRQVEAFQTITVADVMIPRADIRALELDASFAEVVSAFADSEHSRLPVYRRTLDDPVGLVHLKDVFRILAKAAPSDPPTDGMLSRLKRQTLFVPPSMRAADLLVRMQAGRIHMAMVIDEFGGLDGLVTLEDILEALVGEIDDEHDEAEPGQIVGRPGGVLEIDARLELAALEEALGVSFAMPDEEDPPDTAGGLIMTRLGRLPERGEVVVLPGGFEFEVIDADPRRIKRLRVRPSAP